MKILLVDEVAEKLRLSKFTVRKKARKGELKAKKNGRDWLFDADYIDEYMKKIFNTTDDARHESSNKEDICRFSNVKSQNTGK